MITTAILAALVPGALATLVLALAFRVWRRDAPAAPAALPPALALAYAAGAWILVGWPALPPVIANEILFVVIVALGALGPLWTLDAVPRPVRWATSLLVSLLVPWLLFDNLLETTWTGAGGWLRLTALGLALFALWTATAALGDRTRGPSLPLAWLLAGSGAAAALTLAGSALLGQLAGALTAGLGAVLLLAWRRPDLPLGRGTAPVFAVAYGGLLCLGAFYAELPLLAALLLAAAPLLPWLAELPALRRRGGWLTPALRALVVLAALGGAVGLALQPPAPPDEAAGGAAGGANQEPEYEYEYDYTNLGK